MNNKSSSCMYGMYTQKKWRRRNDGKRDDVINNGRRVCMWRAKAMPRGVVAPYITYLAMAYVLNYVDVLLYVLCGIWCSGYVAALQRRRNGDVRDMTCTIQHGAAAHVCMCALAATWLYAVRISTLSAAAYQRKRLRYCICRAICAAVALLLLLLYARNAVEGDAGGMSGGRV